MSFNDMTKSLRRARGELLQLTEGLEAKVAERTREIEDMQQKLLHSEKMASLGELVITSYSIHYTKLYDNRPDRQIERALDPVDADRNVDFLGLGIAGRGRRLVRRRDEEAARVVRHHDLGEPGRQGVRLGHDPDTGFSYNFV